MLGSGRQGRRQGNFVILSRGRSPRNEGSLREALDGFAVALLTVLLALIALLTALATSITLAHDDHDLDSATPDSTPDSVSSTGTGVVYLTITNEGDQNDALLEVSTEHAERVEIHESVVENDLARMRPVDGPMVVPAGETVTFEPGGLHLMLVNLTDDIRPGDTFEVMLTFEQAGTVTVPVSAVLDPEDSVSESVTAGELTIEEIWSRPAPRIDGLSGTPVGTPHADDEHQH